MTTKHDPRAPFTISLPAFKDWPEDERPTFTYRRCSGRESLLMAEALDAVDEDAKNYLAVIAGLYAAAKIGLLGWDKQIDLATGDALPFDPENLDCGVGHAEIVQLVQLRMHNGHPAAEARS